MEQTLRSRDGVEERAGERETERIAGPKPVSAFWWLLVSACVLALFFRES